VGEPLRQGVTLPLRSVSRTAATFAANIGEAVVNNG
jgi:hypothetical protein